jgi:hypothetical protein
VTICDKPLCPKHDTERFLLHVQRVANVAENMGLSEQEILDRVAYIMEGLK